MGQAPFHFQSLFLIPFTVSRSASALEIDRLRALAGIERTGRWTYYVSRLKGVNRINRYIVARGYVCSDAPHSQEMDARADRGSDVEEDDLNDLSDLDPLGTADEVPEPPAVRAVSPVAPPAAPSAAAAPAAPPPA